MARARKPVPQTRFKQQAHRLIRELPEDAGWPDLATYVQRKIAFDAELERLVEQCERAFSTPRSHNM